MSEPDPYQTKPPQSAERESPLSADAPAHDQHQYIGRYRLERVLGEGGFGRVYLAHDDQLHRPVAIKVPHRHRVSEAHDAAAYLAEARILAGLDHPNIVPVHDVGSTGDGLCYVVSKVIEGSDLAKKIQEARPSAAESAGLVAAIAEALHYAHRQGLVHRDIKPGNILIDSSGKPYVADFGLALREEDFGTGPSFAGTPAYMSPEQARREGHRVDARSDVFSLGVVFYELLTGVLPFGGNNLFEVLKEIKTLEPCPPRQLDEAIPEELERICLKALAKRAMERYTTAKDVADDLRYFLDHASEQEKSVLGPAVPPSPAPQAAATRTPSDTPASDQRPIKIVPKGLRSFDAGDADFFLELLPGPRDRTGLPDSIRFWQRRIEATDPDQAFSVGLLYGPSGCGKSSLVKAGLLPRLADHVLVIYVESTAGETEARLLKGLRKRCPDLRPLTLPSPPDGGGESRVRGLGLVEALAGLRRGKVLPSGKKVLLVLDQFEQWLHAKRQEQNTELVQALRQCDGEHVQCLVLVRDDFWLAVSRFIRDLEVRLVEGHNTALVDLFDPLHARKVLAEFGRAFSRLPDRPARLTPEQERFLDQTVAGLTRDGKIISVRLSLFAEMVKGKPWTPATLKEVGGTEGIGGRFLEDTFSASAAPAEHRLHQQAAQAVLRALLPEEGTKIRGHMRSQQELLEASGYARQPGEFEDLLRILDTELRLITPTDPEAVSSGQSVVSRKKEAGSDGGQARPGPEDGSRAPLPSAPCPLPTAYYQLTHDYLVPALRQWLTRKQKETRRGRAELRLAERAALWNARPENRHLPAWWEWANIWLFARRRDWAESQRDMMRAATRYHALRSLLATVVLLVAAMLGRWELHRQNANHADELVKRLLDAEISQVPKIFAEIEGYHRWADAQLVEITEDSQRTPTQQLKARLALLPVDSIQVDHLYGRLLDAQPSEVPVIRDALLAHKEQLLDTLWSVVEQPEKGKESQRLRAACALATYDSESRRWDQVREPVAVDLVGVPASYLATWMDSLRPVGTKLVAPLAVVFRDAKRRETERSLAAAILAEYAADQPQVLADLLMQAEEKQFAVLFPKLREQGDRGLTLLHAEVDMQLRPVVPEDEKEKLAKRQANAAMALLKMDRSEKVWPLLKDGEDPRLRTYLIHRFSLFGIGPQVLIQRLEKETVSSIRLALILSLGEYEEDKLPPDERQRLVPKLLEWYRKDRDPGIHSAVDWLLRQRWKQAAQLQGIDRELATGQPRRDRRWYVNREGHTMAIIPGPVKFLMGSPDTEPDRSQKNETLHARDIGRSFAIATKEVTVEQFQRFWCSQFGVEHDYSKEFSPDRNGPMISLTWFEAAQYCRWLSEQEEIPEDQMCYPPVAEIETCKDGKTPLKLPADYLTRTGYRLPTEAEWEYACRAGAATSRFYGASEEMLEKYAWYECISKSRTWPVGLLKPNDLGLFDIYGNVWEWCHDPLLNYPQGLGGPAYEDKEDSTLIVTHKLERVFRGGSFKSRAADVRSASRNWNEPTWRDQKNGLRVAKTYRSTR